MKQLIPAKAISNPLPSEEIQRDVVLYLDRSENSRTVKLLLTSNPGKPWGAELVLEEPEQFDFFEECRNIWEKEVVNARFKDPVHPHINHKLFQESWDFRNRGQLIKSIAPKLAVAGNNLFSSLFEIRQSTQAQQLAARLRYILSNEPKTITFISDTFHAPWPLIYTHPQGELNNDGSNFVPTGFWGYQHAIEHTPQKVQDCRPSTKPNSRLGFRTSFNFDYRIDGTLGVNCVGDHRDFLKSLKQLTVKERKTKNELEQDFQSSAFDDQLVFFFCHCEVSRKSDGSRNLETCKLSLSDDIPIHPQDFDRWRYKPGLLKSQPIVIMNACQAAQMRNFLFPSSIAARLVELGAKCLLGPQTNLPAVFADAFTKGLMEALLEENEQPVRIGFALRQQARKFFDEHNNPLGLIFSLYYGLDTYLENKEVESA